MSVRPALSPSAPIAVLLLTLVLAGLQPATVYAQATGPSSTRPPARRLPDAWLTSEDLRVTRNIRNALEREVMDSDPAAIRVQTRKGAVILSGTVDSVSERSQVEALVHQTPGAQTLSDRLRIRIQ